MYHVICFYWQGDRWREEGSVSISNSFNYHQYHLNRAGFLPRGLPSVYVNFLYRGVKRFAPFPFKFVCFTNDDNLELDRDIEVRPFYPPTTMGVMPRLWMFNKDAGLLGSQVLALDLDIVIVGNLNTIMTYEGRFCARSKFKHGMEHLLDGDIISFKADEETHERFWEQFVDNKQWAEDYTKGRERFWFRHVIGDEADRWNKIAPGQVISYKRHVRGHHKTIPQDARIISCHGVPRPHQIGEQWVKKYWGQIYND